MIARSPSCLLRCRRRRAAAGGASSPQSSVAGAATDDAQVAVVRAADAAVALASFGENILVENSDFTRQPGGINVDAGTIFERTLTLRNASLTADVIKARAFQNGGRDGLVHVREEVLHAGRI